MTRRSAGQLARAYFTKRFKECGTAERAKNEKAYMKSALRFFGATMPDVRAAAREYRLAIAPIDHEDLVDIATTLFATDYHELRNASIALLEREQKTLTTSDLPLLLSFVRQASNWAHVDWLAAKVIGPIIHREPKGETLLRQWAKDEHMWIRRTALLACLDRLRIDGDFELFEELATPMLQEKVFWIRKAIGWVLREVSKKRPALVRGFIRRHRKDMSGLTLREASKYI